MTGAQNPPTGQWGPPPATPPEEPAAKTRKLWPWIVGAVVAIGATVGGGDTDDQGHAAPAVVDDVTEQVVEADPAPESDAPAQAEAATAPEMTADQTHALRSAQSYIDMFGFSRSGLIGQLTFEGCNAEQAAFGADSVGL